MMTGYSKLTDGEISVLVCKALHPGRDVRPHSTNPKGAEYIRYYGNKLKYELGFFPVSRVEDGFPIITRNRIAIAPAGKTTWQASHESGLKASHKNPLRAAMIVYLMLQDSIQNKSEGGCA